MVKYTKNKMLSLFTAILTFILISPSMINEVSAASLVTERELLMLSIMSYSDSQKQNVWKMTDDEDFNKKWFCGYTDASELRGWKMVDYKISKNNTDNEGFSAVCYKKNNNVVVAFRGTDDGIISENWKYILPYTEHPQAKYVREYINDLELKWFINLGTNVYLTGHSLGGYLALYGTGVILQHDYLKNRFVKTATFNGLGMGYLQDKDMEKKLSSLDDSKLTNYRIYGDVVSTMGKHFTGIKTLKFINNKNDSGAPSNVLKNPHFPHHFLVQSPCVL